MGGVPRIDLVDENSGALARQCPDVTTMSRAGRKLTGIPSSSAKGDNGFTELYGKSKNAADVLLRSNGQN